MCKPWKYGHGMENDKQDSAYRKKLNAEIDLKDYERDPLTLWHLRQRNA